MYDGGIEQVIAIRFPSVDVSAPVNTAWLLFDVDEADAWQAGQSVVIAIAGELDANSREIVDTGDGASLSAKGDRTEISLNAACAALQAP